MFSSVKKETLKLSNYIMLANNLFFIYKQFIEKEI